MCATVGLATRSATYITRTTCRPRRSAPSRFRPR
jgi:hypothetical protein